MPNNFSNIKSRGGLIASDAAGFLSDHVQFVKAIDKEDVSVFDGKNGYKSGDTVKINVPSQFTVGTTATVTPQDVNESSVDLTVNKQRNVAIAVNSTEFATDQEYGRWREMFLKPAMIQLANQIERECLVQAYQSVWNTVGTAGSTTFDTDTVLAAGQAIDESACEDYGNRFVLLNPAANRSAVNARKGLFNDQAEVAKQYREGAMGRADGFTFLRNNLIATHINGTATGTILVNGAGQTGATLNIDGASGTQTLTAGQVFTIANVFAVHPVTKSTLPKLQQFVVTAPATAAAGVFTGVQISPAIVTSGATQTVSAGPADNAAITFVGGAGLGFAQNMAFHKSAFRFCSVPLIMPKGLDMVGQESKDGITVRMVQDYDVVNDRMILRADVLFGMANVRSGWAARMTS